MPNFRALICLTVAWWTLCAAMFAQGETKGASAPEVGHRVLILPMDHNLPLDPGGKYSLAFSGQEWVPNEDFDWGPMPKQGPPSLQDKPLTWEQVERWEGPSKVGTQMGDELIYRLPDGAWGWVRILHRTPDWIQLEQLTLSGEQALARSSALELAGSSEPEGHRLSWVAEPGVTFGVFRWNVGMPEPFELLQQLQGDSYLDGSAPAGRLVEYSVRRLERVDGTPIVGPIQPSARLRLVRQEHPGDWPLELEVGLGINLLTGMVHGPNPHLEVHQIIGTQVLLRAAESSPIATRGKGARNDQWEAPLFEPRVYMPRIRSVEVGTSAFFYLPESGTYGRISFQKDDQDRVLLLRSMNLNGGRVLPHAPIFRQWEMEAQGMALSFDALDPLMVPELEQLERVIEIEKFPGSGDWEEHSTFPAAEYQSVIALEPPRPELPLVHLRFRYRYGKNHRSVPSDPVAVLAMDPNDAKASQHVQAAALQALSSDEYQERFVGEHVLRCIGPTAWPNLLDIYSNGDGIASDLARQILLSPEGVASGQLERVMRRAGQAARLPDPFPAIWFHPDPEWRLYQILLDHGHTEWLPWLDLVARLDPDGRVREMARLLQTSPVVPAPIGRRGRDGIWASAPPDFREQAGSPDWAFELDGAGTDDAAAAIRAAVDGARLNESQSLLALARVVESMSLEYGSRNPYSQVLLGLGLVDLHRQRSRSVLLEAVREGVVDPGSSILAWRDLMDWRLDADTLIADETREVIRLSEPSLAALQQTLAGLEVNGKSYVDVILPPGLYRPMPGLDPWLDLQTQGLALIGESGVQLQVGLRASGIEDLVLANFTLDNRSGTSLALTGSTCTVRNVIISGSQTPVSLQDSILEMEACSMQKGEGKSSSVALRMMGPCLVMARGCRFQAGGWILGDQGQVYLDRTLIDAGDRPVFQGQRGGQLILRDCAIIGGSSCFQGLQSARLEGVLSTLRNQALGPQNDGVFMCPTHTHSIEPWQEGQGMQILDRCPLDSDR